MCGACHASQDSSLREMAPIARNQLKSGPGLDLVLILKMPG